MSNVTAAPRAKKLAGGKNAEACASRVSVMNAASEFSVFHEPWWLDIAAAGCWRMARVTRQGRVVGEMPYVDSRVGIWRVSGLPLLTRTLGPVIYPAGAKPVEEARYQLSVLDELIDQLPDFDRFHQNFDPRIEDALAFQMRGFALSQSYTFRIPRGQPLDDVWAGMRHQTRNVIRSAASKITARTTKDLGEFIDFYARSQLERNRENMYGHDLMEKLLEAFVRRNRGKLIGAYSSSGELVAAVALVWDRHSMYYLLSSRSKSAHSGSISLLLWTAIQEAHERGLVFDFDGIASSTILRFLSGFGGVLVPRIGIERLKAGYSMARHIRDLSLLARRSIHDAVKPR